MSRRFWAAVGVQVAILLGMIGLHGYTLLTGQPVILQGAPLDPWDPLRGEYVALHYAISELEATLPMAGWPYNAGQRVWVTLRQGDPYWTAVSVSDRQPEGAGDEVALRGRIRWIDPGEGRRPGRIAVDYGIEQVYVPEGQGRALEGQLVELDVQAAVDRNGRAVIRALYLEGEPIVWR